MIILVTKPAISRINPDGDAKQTHQKRKPPDTSLN